MSAPILAVVGATATGKTSLGIHLAGRFNGEIINADSRQVYCGMDIGTAKPTEDEQRRARHWLIDCAAPDEPVTLASYLDAANGAVEDISSRGRLPIIVGGTGQYAWALLEGWRVPRVPPDRHLRAELELLAARDGVDALFAILQQDDPASAATIERRNVRRVIRAIEVTRATGRPFSAWRGKRSGRPAIILGLRMPRPELYARIDQRVEMMIAAGLVEEVKELIRGGYRCGLASMESIGYRQICDHLQGRHSLPEAIARIKTETHRLARMQHAWFRADDPRIIWLDGGEPSVAADAAQLVERALASG